MFYREHSRLTLDCGAEQVTKQSHKDECDIHNILRQYQRTGILTHIQNSKPEYLDLPDQIDYQEAMNTIVQAQDAFAALPATVRDSFNNDPARFLSAFTDPNQETRLRELGLLNPKPKADPTTSSPAPEQSS